MGQDKRILHKIRNLKVANDVKCLLAMNVYNELLKCDRIANLTIDYDAEVGEIFFVADRDGHRSIYLPTPAGKDIAFRTVEHFQRRRFEDVPGNRR